MDDGRPAAPEGFEHHPDWVSHLDGAFWSGYYGRCSSGKTAMRAWVVLSDDGPDVTPRLEVAVDFPGWSAHGGSAMMRLTMDEARAALAWSPEGAALRYKDLFDRAIGGCHGDRADG